MKNHNFVFKYKINFVPSFAIPIVLLLLVNFLSSCGGGNTKNMFSIKRLDKNIAKKVEINGSLISFLDTYGAISSKIKTNSDAFVIPNTSILFIKDDSDLVNNQIKLGFNPTSILMPENTRIVGNRDFLSKIKYLHRKNLISAKEYSLMWKELRRCKGLTYLDCINKDLAKIEFLINFEEKESEEKESEEKESEEKESGGSIYCSANPLKSHLNAFLKSRELTKIEYCREDFEKLSGNMGEIAMVLFNNLKDINKKGTFLVKNYSLNEKVFHLTSRAYEIKAMMSLLMNMDSPLENSKGDKILYYDNKKYKGQLSNIIVRLVVLQNDINNFIEANPIRIGSTNKLKKPKAEITRGKNNYKNHCKPKNKNNKRDKNSCQNHRKPKNKNNKRDKNNYQNHHKPKNKNNLISKKVSSSIHLKSNKRDKNSCQNHHKPKNKNNLISKKVSSSTHLKSNKLSLQYQKCENKSRPNISNAPKKISYELNARNFYSEILKLAKLEKNHDTIEWNDQLYSYPHYDELLQTPKECNMAFYETLQLINNLSNNRVIYKKASMWYEQESLKSLIHLGHNVNCIKGNIWWELKTIGISNSCYLYEKNKNGDSTDILKVASEVDGVCAEYPKMYNPKLSIKNINAIFEAKMNILTNSEYNSAYHQINRVKQVPFFFIYGGDAKNIYYKKLKYYFKSKPLVNFINIPVSMLTKYCNDYSFNTNKLTRIINATE